MADGLTSMLTLIKNARLYAPAAMGSGHLLIGGGKILVVSQELPQINDSLLSETIDVRGARVIPGLIDGHTHITGGGGEAGFASQVPSVPLSHFTRAGVTSVVGLLGTDDVTRNTANLLARVRGLREEGLSAYCYTGGYHFPPTTLTGSIKNDIVHIDCIIGVGELAISDHRSSQLSIGELARVAADAHVAGMITAKAGIVHLHMGDGQRGLEMVRSVLNTTELPARVFHPTHVNRRKALFAEACELAAAGSWVDVTAFPVAEDEDAWSAAAAWMRYHDGGGPAGRFTISSDGGGCLPYFNEHGEVTAMDVGRSQALADTLRELLAQGVPLERVLPCMTSNVADLLRLTGKGRLTQGADADLAVLAEDGSVTDVMARGCWHLRDGLVRRRGTFE